MLKAKRSTILFCMLVFSVLVGISKPLLWYYYRFDRPELRIQRASIFGDEIQLVLESTGKRSSIIGEADKTIIKGIFVVRFPVHPKSQIQTPGLKFGFTTLPNSGRLISDGFSGDRFLSITSDPAQPSKDLLELYGKTSPDGKVRLLNSWRSKFYSKSESGRYISVDDGPVLDLSVGNGQALFENKPLSQVFHIDHPETVPFGLITDDLEFCGRNLANDGPTVFYSRTGKKILLPAQTSKATFCEAQSTKKQLLIRERRDEEAYKTMIVDEQLNAVSSFQIQPVAQNRASAVSTYASWDAASHRVLFFPNADVCDGKGQVSVIVYDYATGSRDQYMLDVASSFELTGSGFDLKRN